MEFKDYAEYSLSELYDLYAKMDKEGNPIESQSLYDEILKKEKLESVLRGSDNLASLSDRLLAVIVDMFIAGLPISIVLIIIFGFRGMIEFSLNNGIYANLILLLIGQSLYLSVNGYLLYKNGQTIGKKVLGIKIVTLESKLPKLYESYGLRYFIPALLPLVPIYGGLISIIDVLFIFRKDRRCIHDHIASTKVIKEVVA